MPVIQLYNLEDLKDTELPDFWELIEGELFELSPSTPNSSALALKLGAAVLQFVESNGLGEVYGTDGGFLIEADPDSLVAPDVTYLANEKMPGDIPNSGFPRIIPDFAIEVLSPSDRPSHVRAKQALYGRVGVRLVWWVDLSRRQTLVQTPHADLQVVDWDDVLDGGDVLPGFRIRMSVLAPRRLPTE